MGLLVGDKVGLRGVGWEGGSGQVTGGAVGFAVARVGLFVGLKLSTGIYQPRVGPNVGALEVSVGAFEGERVVGGVGAVGFIPHVGTCGENVGTVVCTVGLWVGLQVS